ncbi:hypothetical protein [Aquibacillus salsiterrae]|uniref:Uncharacterized protein n=1 Tax=Aquibacillus salsiterrae TaxID=2950439 RepID=A0A9X4AFV9_9BACI|nr:hypothetical protein [Aquibacillus salsiterrae]MDC3418316.1 hypothetical protein [Aquibacillus salsiterrae]
MFFEKRESTKLFKAIRMIVMISFGIIFVISIINGLDFGFLRLAFIFGGFTSLIDGLESYLKKDDKWKYIVDFDLAIIWFITIFIFW